MRSNLAEQQIRELLAYTGTETERFTVIAIWHTLENAKVLGEYLLRYSDNTEKSFDAYTLISSPLNYDLFPKISNQILRTIAEESYGVFHCLNDWVSQYYFSSVSLENCHEELQNISDIETRLMALVRSNKHE